LKTTSEVFFIWCKVGVRFKILCSIPELLTDKLYNFVGIVVAYPTSKCTSRKLYLYPEDKRCVIEVADDNRSEVEKFSRLDQFLSLGLPHLQKFSIKAVTELRERKDIVKVGRNQPCPCGSGMKFKKCCGKELFYRHTRYIVTPKEFISLE
jgi:hypothetical protein